MKQLRHLRLRAGILLALLGIQPTGHTQVHQLGDEPSLKFESVLAAGPVGFSGRSFIRTDSVERHLVEGKWTTPVDGGSMMLPEGSTSVWTRVEARTDESIRSASFRGGYAYAEVVSNRDRSMILRAAGHGVVYVNGEPRAGDVYSYGYLHLPVALKQGTNTFLFSVGRGSLKAALAAPKKELFLDDSDPTLPDLRPSDAGAVKQGALVVVNAGERHHGKLRLRAAPPFDTAEKDAGHSITPLTSRKLPFQFRAMSVSPGASVKIPVELVNVETGEVLDRIEVGIRQRHPHQTFKETFESQIDRSIQYYAVSPAKEEGPGKALFLSLHGASVEATSQVDAYAPKEWGYIVAPTNRRPYGFDWEEWGRMDALEVLALALQKYPIDPARVHLTGHSMGGHGTWHLGANFPDRFAAIGPSAGWISFSTYAGGRGRGTNTPSAMEQLLQRASGTGDTLALARNYATQGVYVLHGDADDNVPVREARRMKEALAEFHRDFLYHEQAGAGHWWESSDEPGAECMDWPPMYDLFARRVLPPKTAVRVVDFVTANPGVSPSSHWLGILAQQTQFSPASARIQLDPGKRRFAGSTTNVARLALDIETLGGQGPVVVHLDGSTLEFERPTVGSQIHLVRDGQGWAKAGAPVASEKGPHRYGLFKDAFRHGMLFIYGTRGDAEENQWAYAKARLDAENFYYRGNGSIEVIPDTAFDPEKEPNRGVILYGHKQMNGAWEALLGSSPVVVERGGVQVGGESMNGDQLGCLFVRPRPGSDTACVAVVAGSGPAGLRLTDRVPYFLAGVGVPDLVVFTPEMLGSGASGIELAGYFGLDWTVENGEFERRAK